MVAAIKIGRIFGIPIYLHLTFLLILPLFVYVFSSPSQETEVLGLLARGLTNKDIAQSLMLSVRTVEAHLRSIFGKLAVGSRTEAALWAVRHGYGEDAT